MSVAFRRKTDEDPWRITRLIGRTCKGRNTFSEAVLTVEDLVAPTGFRSAVRLNAFGAGRNFNSDFVTLFCIVPGAGESRRPELSVTIGRRKHLFPSRTQQLSSCRR